MLKLIQIINGWKTSANNHDRSVFQKFQTIFSIHEERSVLVLPEKLRLKALNEWMKGDEKLAKSMENQTVIFIKNLITGDENIHNEVRGSKPEAENQISETQLIESLSKKTEVGCDFCDYKNYTGEDEYGRFTSEFAYTMANAFKLDTWNSMVAFNTHHPIKWTLTELIEAMDHVDKWFKKVHKISPTHCYPVATWDMLPPSGGSQVHPHLHMLMNNRQYYGNFGRWYEVSQRYDEKHDISYWNVMIEIVTALDLAVKYEDNTAFVNLTPIKGHEIILHCEKPDTSTWRLLYSLIRTYSAELAVHSFSMAMIYPIMGEMANNKGPFIARILPRGHMNSSKSDICSLELFASPNVNVPPQKTAEILHKALQLLQDNEG